MSTRCNVHVMQSGCHWEEKVQLYHHCDGYPSNMLPLFAKAFEDSRKRIEKYAKKHGFKHADYWEMGRAGKAAGMIIASDVGQFEPECGLDLHGDIDYFYLVEVRNSKDGSMAEEPTWYVTVYQPPEYTGKDGGDGRKFYDTRDLKLLRKASGPTEVVQAARELEESQTTVS